MALIEELEKSGNWLFRWRSYLPLTVLVVALALLPRFEYLGQSEKLDHYWEFFCLFVSFFGLAIRCFTIGYTPKNTSGRNTKNQVADTLNTTGIYSLVRNPLYLGNYFMFLGVVLFLHSIPFTLIFTLVFFIYYERIIFAEESFLRKKFGEAYLEWAEKCPPIIPKFSGYKKPRMPFSLKNVLRREYNGFFAVILTMFLFETLGEIPVNGELDFDLFWIILVSAAFIIWITLRTLKKKTQILSVEGR